MYNERLIFHFIVLNLLTQLIKVKCIIEFQKLLESEIGGKNWVNIFFIQHFSMDQIHMKSNLDTQTYTHMQLIMHL